MKNRKTVNRRNFVKCVIAGSAVLAVKPGILESAARAGGHKQTESVELPYPKDALSPHISAETLSYHYGKHHKGYMKKLQGLKGKEVPLRGEGLVKIIKSSAGKAGEKDVFNNAAQVWNHTFFWNSMKPSGGGNPKGELAGRIMKDFGDMGKFKKEFAEAAASRFGSGWAWLVTDGGKLEIMNTMNADTPIAHGKTPLLTIDVWEHAYYLDYQNRRGDFIKAYLDHLINWDFAAVNCKATMAQK